MKRDVKAFVLAAIVAVLVFIATRRLPEPWDLIATLVLCATAVLWAIHELLWLRQMRHRLEAIEREAERWQRR